MKQKLIIATSIIIVQTALLAFVYLFMCAAALTWNPIEWEIWQRAVALFSVLVVIAATFKHNYAGKIRFETDIRKP